MVIDIISYNTIKVVMSDDELSEFDLNYKKIDENDLNTQMMILHIIDEIKTQKSIDLSSEKIYIEIFPIKSSGCLFYISYIDNTITSTKAVCETITYKTEDINDIFSICMELSEKKNILDSQLYYGINSFYIILNTFSDSNDKVFKNKRIHNSFIPGEAYACMVREHYDCICDTDAMKLIAELK